MSNSEENNENNTNNEENKQEIEKDKEPEKIENNNNEKKEDKKEFNNSFRNDLWEGTKKIYDRYDAGKKTLTDMISIFKMRAEGEEKFIKELTSITNKTHSLREGGSCGTAWLDIRNSHKEKSKNHTVLLESIRKDIIAPLEQFKKEKQQIKEKLSNEEKNLCSQLKSGKEKVENLREKYHSLSDQAEVALLNLKKARNDPSFDKKKMVKLEENNNRLSSESIKAHEQYKQTLSELNIFQRKYEEEMHKILEALQEIEEERLTFLKQILEKYLEFNDKFIISERENHVSITKCVISMNRDQDLKNWIESNKTGIDSKEIPIEYVPYVLKYSGDVSTVPKPKISLFSKLGFGKKTKKPSGPTKETDKPKTNISTPIKVEHKTTLKESKDTPSSPKETKETKTENTDSDVEVVEVKKAKALFDFVKTEDNELSFKIGDILNITRIDDSGWWEGELNGEIGLIPGNYLQLLGGDTEDEHKNNDSEESKEPKKEEPKKEEPKKEEPKKEEPKKEEPVKEEPKKEPEPKKEEPKKEEPKKEPEPVKEEPKKEPEPKKEEPKKEEPKKEPEPVKEEPKKEPEPENQDDSGEEENNPIGKCVALYDFPGDEEDELTVKAGETVIIYSQVEGWYTGTNEAGEYGMAPANYFGPLSNL